MHGNQEKIDMIKIDWSGGTKDVLSAVLVVLDAQDGEGQTMFMWWLLGTRIPPFLRG